MAGEASGKWYISDCTDEWEALWDEEAGSASIKAMGFERAWDIQGTIKEGNVPGEWWSKCRLVSQWRVESKGFEEEQRLGHPEPSRPWEQVFISVK